MTTAVLERPTAAETSDTGDTDNLIHVEMCCYPNEALCGADLTGSTEFPQEAPTTCIVCADLENSPLDCQEIRAQRAA